MKLLDRMDGKASLELRPAEVDAAFDRLRAFGSLSIDRQATHDVLRIGAHEFVYLDEWDEPCLISSDAAGTAMLVEVAAGSAPRLAATG